MRVTIGRVYWTLGLFNQTQMHVEQALKIRKELLGENHPYTFEGAKSLAGLLVELERFNDAESPALAWHERCVAHAGADHARSQQVVGILVDLYERQGRISDSTRWRSQLGG